MSPMVKDHLLGLFANSGYHHFRSSGKYSLLDPGGGGVGVGVGSVPAGIRIFDVKGCSVRLPVTGLPFKSTYDPDNGMVMGA